MYSQSLEPRSAEHYLISLQSLLEAGLAQVAALQIDRLRNELHALRAIVNATESIAAMLNKVRFYCYKAYQHGEEELQPLCLACEENDMLGVCALVEHDQHPALENDDVVRFFGHSLENINIKQLAIVKFLGFM